MRKDVSNWWKQSQRDLESAKNSYDSEDFYVTAFLAQQSVEKGLKALMLKEQNQLIKTHNVIRLARMLDFPRALLVKIASLEPVYQEARYPDVSDLPYEEFEEADAAEFIKAAQEVLQWINKKMK